MSASGPDYEKFAKSVVSWAAARARAPFEGKYDVENEYDRESAEVWGKAVGFDRIADTLHFYVKPYCSLTHADLGFGDFKPEG